MLNYPHQHKIPKLQARPSLRALGLLALQRGAPFIGFGIVDNAIMIVAGACVCVCMIVEGVWGDWRCVDG